MVLMAAGVTTRRCGISIHARVALVAATLLGSLVLSGCIFRYNDGYARQGHSVANLPPGRIADSENPEEGTAACPDSHTPLSPSTVAVQANWSSHPNASPSYREQREARAMIREMEKVRLELNETGATAIITNNGASSRAHDVRFVAEAGALTLTVNASPCLNQLRGSPHALSLVVYHLSDTMELERLAQTRAGLGRLIAAEDFDRSVKSVRRYDLQPGDQRSLVLDRPDGGKYVALVAGYHEFQEANCQVFAYPVEQFAQKIQTTFFKSKAPMFSPAPLDLYVKLDEQAMSAAATPARYDTMLESVKRNPYQYARAR